MTIVAQPYTSAVPNYLYRPKITVQFRMLRDGEVTPERKVIRVFRDWSSVGKLDMCFEAEQGEFSRSLKLDLATVLEQDVWLVTGVDQTPPKRTRAAYLSFVESGIFTFNITSGEGGGGAPGAPGRITGITRVNGAPSDREVVLLERPDDGEWRIAGYGPTPEGTGVIPVNVLGGSVYAVSLDDWGVVFRPGLAVLTGQRIRPSRFAGWLYEITEAGMLPEVEPPWWPADGENPSRALGTARAVAVRYYRPLAHGPVTIEMI